MPSPSEAYAGSDSAYEEDQDDYGYEEESESNEGRTPALSGSDDDDDDDIDFREEGSSGPAHDADTAVPASAEKKSRIRLNVAKKAVVIQAGVAHGCATKNGQALFEKVDKVILPYLSDHYVHLTLSKNDYYLALTRTGYREGMTKVDSGSVVNLFTKGMTNLRRCVKVVPGTEKEEAGPRTHVRPGGKEGDGNHVLDQAVLDWFFDYASTIAGTGESVAKGKGGIRKRKESKTVTRNKRLVFFEGEAKKAKELKEAKETADLENTRLFNEKLASIAASGRMIASFIGGAASANVAMTNYRIWGRIPSAPLSMPPPPPPPTAQPHAPSPTIPAPSPAAPSIQCGNDD